MSYMVSYRVARTGKSHAIVEDLILPAATDMSGAMFGEKAQKTIQTMTSSTTLFHGASVTWQEMF